MSKIIGLATFQKEIGGVCNAYLRYLEEDLEACIEEGEEDYAEQRRRQIDEMIRFAQVVAHGSHQLTPFQE